MKKEYELLSIIFDLIDKIEFQHPNIRDESLHRISLLYEKDNVDTVNCYLDYTWSEIDNVDKVEIIKEYLHM